MKDPALQRLYEEAAPSGPGCLASLFIGACILAFCWAVWATGQNCKKCEKYTCPQGLQPVFDARSGVCICGAVPPKEDK